MNDQLSLPHFDAMGACALHHLGVLQASGPDAASFLHNQLTQDFLLLQPQHARWAAFCNAKGRMQASMVGLKTGPQDLLLVMRQDLLAQTLKRLSMFVLRAKVKLSDASSEWGVWGVFDSAQDPPWTCRPASSGWSVSLYPAAGVSRALQLWPAGQTPALPTLPLEDWLLGDVLSGVADVQAATFEAFVPQMLNYESVDGVNFKKGCYPGQEVVARSQFRGTLKRRTFLVHARAPLQAGQDIFSPSDDTQPAGMVAQAAQHSRFGDWALACLQTQAIEGALYVQGHDKTPLQLLPLPYPLREDL
jgi:tRNA-modifying protein YgfZ